ncbi:cob(I)yrinic acid a,c-diamide adenosyltransferase [Rhodospirillum rubrum]|uniref:Corrinoid adenosyltransferase n=1 Tax=Rhodospirillum rubrum (strain ATCC 11170 / ATH 1.1.1 / DSM 467 / LMG 4362 / NCIMB 8255 / S1) TaxID=269796 RepID=Q2RNY4_RHORT|nr:cob(I)yrinic acid a,c-diamide adenosyltransferase [Rhodospirillum rubrum]ABC24161.1 cob(I)yrinic acid a,c-diamide adenosyltransferase [Rhodospirillum rubrum ATCC 11170]AEO49912.1 cob(I)yrinic acid a,c-diamide adenosyltransferase [Rhodospirillum rubrum F11]MBK5955874.1 cob(I)yrinic acid a,c-diamide adenosyltransferase [Rhodospirillum rubrum]QXG80101.1 cob(I)yrinic acid a,c-diamide adenosyltransferase [Rhodospirillum rubrum]HAP98637.1 cob(I)yrinic acid a,c-diamide adenosyltransferase [Rhodosp
MSDDQIPLADPPFDAAESDDARHRERMAKKKVVRDRMLASKATAKGLLVVHTGTGKGKSTAAFGMVLRCIGHGFPVAIVQFVKGAKTTAERDFLEGFPDLVTIRAMGEGFTWETQDRERDIASARKAWEVAKGFLADPTLHMVVLDEINIVLRYGYLEVAEVIDAVTARPAGQHAVLTGRNAPEALIEAADLVTEMKMIKHPFRAGIGPQPGVEF